jgi:alpha-L-fucosidase
VSDYEPTLASLRSHPVPDWFEDAKFGIFVHWGLFSVPAFAARVGEISDAFASHYDHAMVLTPYTEWYLNAIRTPGSPSAHFHAEHYQNRPYEDFREPFARGLEQWDPAGWARLFRRAGARYVVLVTKHHDGYCLWPSRHRNPMQDSWCTERDVVGELASAVRAEGLRFGVYYSGGIDWSFNTKGVRTFGEFIASTPRGAYPAYAEAQLRELIERYEPSVLWNDISWPTPLRPMLQLMADYYAAVTEGVINDRWMHQSAALQLLRLPPVRLLADWFLRRQTEKAAARGEGGGIVPPRPAHCDFRTPEYTTFDDIRSEKWEATRGMSASFAYNRNDGEEDYAPASELLLGFIDSVAKNGNLLLNVGPRGEDAEIPLSQVARLEALGSWLETNGEAIYGTRPWRRAEGQTDAELPVRFTHKKNTLYAIVLGTPGSREFALRDLQLLPDSTITCLTTGQAVEGVQQGADLQLRCPTELAASPAHAFSISPAPQ